MDDFKKVQYREISVGGYQCGCCSPVACKNKRLKKKKLHKRARTRLRIALQKQIVEE